MTIVTITSGLPSHCSKHISCDVVFSLWLPEPYAKDWGLTDSPFSHFWRGKSEVRSQQGWFLLASLLSLQMAPSSYVLTWPFTVFLLSLSLLIRDACPMGRGSHPDDLIFQ